MLAIIMGIATAFNILIIFKKIELKRFQDAFFDAGVLVTLTLVFGGSLGGMMVATVASAIVSIYFLFNKPTFLQTLQDSTTKKESTPEDFDSLLDVYGLK